MLDPLGDNELMIMRKAGKITRYILKKLSGIIKPGIATKKIEEFFMQTLRDHSGMEAAFKGFSGYPAHLCVSLNEEIIHGIPSSRTINDGDIVSVDLGIKYKGFFVDTAYTYIAGQRSKLAKRLIDVTRGALGVGIKKVRVGVRVGDIGCAIENFVERNGFSVIRKFVGHGIGRGLHLPPEIPNFGKAGVGEKLEEGDVIAIEPMVAVGNPEVEVLSDGWTAKTKDNSLSAHFEHTVAVTKWGAKILTN